MINKRLILLLVVVSIVLLIPFIAMQFTNEVNWDIYDFAIMGVLLFGATAICEFVMRKVKGNKKRLLICGAILFVLFLFWAELSVGIFGTVLAGS